MENSGHLFHIIHNEFQFELVFFIAFCTDNDIVSILQRNASWIHVL